MNIVWQNKDGTNRVAKIDGKFYPYHFSRERGQVTFGKWVARHTEFGVKYVSRGYSTLEKAKRALWSSQSRWETLARRYGGY